MNRGIHVLADIIFYKEKLKFPRIGKD